jgi:hypothetical protein
MTKVGIYLNYSKKFYLGDGNMIKIINKIINKFSKKNNDIYSLCVNAKGELLEYCIREDYR